MRPLPNMVAPELCSELGGVGPRNVTASLSQNRT